MSKICIKEKRIAIWGLLFIFLGFVIISVGIDKNSDITILRAIVVIVGGFGFILVGLHKVLGYYRCLTEYNQHKKY